ncbi:MAG: cell wall hydrolase [Sphingomonas sp.]|nr:cell wall hydrolase [Sphingomonas sp.]
MSALDLVVPHHAPSARRARGWRASRLFLAVLAVVVALLASALFWLSSFARTQVNAIAEAFVPVPPPARPLALRAEDLGVGRDKLQALSPEQAVLRNRAVPLWQGANPAAQPLSLLQQKSETWERALSCLTAAIYYEAALEPEPGQRAVAQVVLNRVRHPLYPKTVCDVVYQGHERATGCQFSFTCDGALARQPEPRLWERARRIAAAALAGSVYQPVGLATNYHADYVVPIWMTDLLKVAVVGRHIFYRLPGQFGAPGAFGLAYAGHEPENPGQGGGLAIASEAVEPPIAATAAPADRPLLPNAAGAPPVAAQPAASANRWLLPMDATPPPPGAVPAPSPVSTATPAATPRAAAP